MNILAIETAMGNTSVAIRLERRGSPLSFVQRLTDGMRQAESIVPLIAAVMREADLDFPALDRIAVCVGPGGFSGIRTGVAAARGIGLAAGVPVAGATSFKVMAAAVLDGDRGDLPFGLAAPAGHEMFFCQTVPASGAEASPIVALTPADIASFFSNGVRAIFGPAALPLQERGLIALSMPVFELYPDALLLVGLAPELDPAIDLPVPFYVRPPDAKAQTGYAIERENC